MSENNDIKPWDIKDPWIKTELKDKLSRINLLKEITLDKRENVLMFCPKCLKLSNFRKVPYFDWVYGEDHIIYQCNECKKKFVDDPWDRENGIERLITINDLLAPYQTDIQIMEMKEDAFHLDRR